MILKESLQFHCHIRTMNYRMRWNLSPQGNFTLTSEINNTNYKLLFATFCQCIKAFNFCTVTIYLTVCIERMLFAVVRVVHSYLCRTQFESCKLVCLCRTQLYGRVVQPRLCRTQFVQSASNVVRSCLVESYNPTKAVVRASVLQMSCVVVLSSHTMDHFQISPL